MLQRFIARRTDAIWYWHFRLKTQPVRPAAMFGFYSQNLGPKIGLALLLSAQYPLHLTFPGSNQPLTHAAEAHQAAVRVRLLAVQPAAASISTASKTSAGRSATSKPYVGLILPIEGIFTTYFSSWHPGVDIAQKAGTAIRPIMGGKVIFAGWDSGGYGLSVLVDHDNGYTSRYAHMSKLKARVGDIVYQETTIGTVGTTGHSTGPHLHLEIYHDDKAINPLQIISATNKLE